MTTALCIACATDIPDLGHLCRRCLGRLRRDLTDLVDLWADLDPAPVKGAAGGPVGKPGSKPPLRLAVVDATDRRGEIHAQVCGWAAIVTEERQLHATIPDVPAAARLMLTHAEWIAEQPWADEAAAEVRDAARIVKALTGNTPDPALGQCSAIDPRGERDRCGGPIRWADDGTTNVVCARCGDTWAEADLPNLLRVTQPSRRFPVPRDWVLERYPVTPGQLRTWVWRGAVRTYHDRQVELFDVLKRIDDANPA